MSTTVEPPNHAVDDTPARTGIWLFLVTEIFAAWGVFLIYWVYRFKFPEDFHFAGGRLDILAGLLSAIALMTGSLTIALAATHLERKRREFSVLFLSASVLLGLSFLIIKFFEWSAKIKEGFFPKSKMLQTHPPGESSFYNMYYLVTGFHGLMVLAGTISLAMLLFTVWRKPIDSHDNNAMIKMENSALLWHMLVVVWIFLFPLFYLLT